jgi:hypothetical protein
MFIRILLSCHETSSCAREVFGGVGHQQRWHSQTPQRHNASLGPCMAAAGASPLGLAGDIDVEMSSLGQNDEQATTTSRPGRGWAKLRGSMRSVGAESVSAQETGIEDSNTVKQLRDHAQTEWGLSRPDIIISVLAGANGAESCISRDNREQILTGDSPVCSMHA